MTNLIANLVVAHTNARLERWYENAKEAFGIDGKGHSVFNAKKNQVEIYYTENNIEYCFVHYWHDDFKINTIFDVWQTEASDTDKI